MYKIHYSPAAREDLLRIKNYIMNDFNEETALNKMEDILVKIKNLEDYPLLGRPLSNRIDVSTDYMYLIINKNYVFYRLEYQYIKIIRVLDSRQDFMHILFDK